jgi:hypothetical protein
MKVFIGWDSREDIAYQVCRKSILKHSSVEVDIQPIVQSELRERGLYWRETDPLSSTEFSFTRFLTASLSTKELVIFHVYQLWASSSQGSYARGGEPRNGDVLAPL